MDEYEFACATVRDPRPYPGEPAPDADRAELAAQLRRVMVWLVDASGNDPVTLAILIARLGGLSYGEIAGRYGISRQAVHKRVAEVARASPAIAGVLHCRFQVRESVAGADADLIQLRRNAHNQLREATQWLERKNQY
jgi:predicted DNA-binding protein YlxM (UPF0122 family)